MEDNLPHLKGLNLTISIKSERNEIQNNNNMKKLMNNKGRY